MFLSNSSFGDVEGDQDLEVPKPVVKRSQGTIKFVLGSVGKISKFAKNWEPRDMNEET